MIPGGTVWPQQGRPPALTELFLLLPNVTPPKTGFSKIPYMNGNFWLLLVFCSVL